MAIRKKRVHKPEAADKGKSLPAVVLPAAASPTERPQPVVLQASSEALMPIQAPVYAASVLQVQGTGNDFILTFSRPIPVQRVGGGLEPGKAMNQAVCVVMVSPQTAKDIALVLKGSVERFEREYGMLKTPYMRRAAGGKERKKKKS